ncbi:clostripain-related cysteine peptidase [Limnothrix redekei]|uniref:Clostripain-related cysteine peptidase n=1 Tax=Limnothrix redekei LRLZ20PSL1 TaxID=3112953 RepID=A0ABW7C7C8_9CYAN
MKSWRDPLARIDRLDWFDRFDRPNQLNRLVNRRSLLTRWFPAGLAWSFTSGWAKHSQAASGRSPMGLLYWMPYDNDLAPAGPKILRWLTEATRRNPTLTLAVQADLPESGKMMRAVLGPLATDRSVVEQSPEVTWIDSDNSADPQNFAEYLRWAVKRFPVEHWALVILGHGGRLDQISPDDQPNHHLDPHPSSPQGDHVRSWLTLADLTTALKEFQIRTNDGLELLFLQNCNRSTLEILASLAPHAHWILASQKLLGEPNAYYDRFCDWLAQNPTANGQDAARAIVRYESPAMYRSYSIINSQAFRELPSVLNPLIDRFLDASVTSSLSPLGYDRLRPYVYFNEAYTDAREFFQLLSNQVPQARTAHAALERWFDRAIELHRSPQAPPNSGLGVGLWLPQTRTELQQRQDLSLYRQTRLAQCLETSLFSR